MTIKSPYNFVPAPSDEEIYTPDWADQVSHDIPFSDGESGEIEVTITAETPIFIRNGHSKDQVENEFSHYIDSQGNKQYFIPATSVKGMLRNVMEIMSFGKLNPNFVNNDRYSYRDLTKNSLYLKNYRSGDVKAGWLIQDSDGSWKIKRSGGLAFIHHDDVDRICGTNFRKSYLNAQGKPKEANARDKYNLVKKALQSKFQIESYESKKYARPSKDGQAGTVVLTGQASARKEIPNEDPSGKVHEFVFLDSEKEEFITVENQLKKDFLFTYYDHDKNNISKDWKYFKEKLNKGENVPVFYTENNGALKHFGLAFMYKLPYKNRIHDLKPIKGINSNSKKDLAEVIFGGIDSDGGLKGRVFISHALIEGDSSAPLNGKKEILASPKASFFPNYLTQNNKNKYNTYEDDHAELKGFKRYPVHTDSGQFNKDFIGEYDEKQLKNQKVFSTFKPLPAKTKFKLKIRYHNLLKAEIGALLSAITFHNSNKYFHSLGGVKPFGYGKVKLKVVNFQGDLKDYMNAFETIMKNHDEKWLESKALKSLFFMASGRMNMEYLKYPKIKEFVEAKNNNGRLTLDSSQIEIKSIDEYFSVTENLNLSEINKYEDLSKKLNNIVNGGDSFDENNVNIIIDKIKEIWNSGHRDSRKDLQKPYQWKNNIPNWIGEDLAYNLRIELGINL